MTKFSSRFCDRILWSKRNLRHTGPVVWIGALLVFWLVWIALWVSGSEGYVKIPRWKIETGIITTGPLWRKLNRLDHRIPSHNFELNFVMILIRNAILVDLKLPRRAVCHCLFKRWQIMEGRRSCSLRRCQSQPWWGWWAPTDDKSGPSIAREK